MGQQLAQKEAKVTKCRQSDPELMVNGALGDGKEMTAAIMCRRLYNVLEGLRGELGGALHLLGRKRQ